MDAQVKMLRTTPQQRVIIGLLLLACWIALWPLKAVDMNTYLLPWLEHIRVHGPVGAFAIPFSNYNPPYLYLLAAASPLEPLVGGAATVKLVSLAGLLGLAGALHHLLRSCGARLDPGAAAALFLLPSVLINVPLLGQCDVFWASACLMAVSAAVRRDHVPMLLWCGVAFAFKAQAIFLAPFVLVYLLAERVPLRLWLLPVIAYAGLLLPAWLAGWPAGDLATIYLRQADSGRAISADAPNLWSIAKLVGVGLEAVPIAFAATAAAALLYVALLRRWRMDAHSMLLAALLAALIMPGLLPKMHDRFFFLADSLAFALFLLAPSRRHGLLVAASQGGSYLGLLAFLHGEQWLAAAGAVSMIGATWLCARDLMQRGRCERKSGAEPEVSAPPRCRSPARAPAAQPAQG